MNNKNIQIIGKEILDLLGKVSTGEFKDFNRISGVAYNVASKRNYTASNGILTLKTLVTNGYTANNWTTYKGAEKIGANVKKGEKSFKSFYWAPFCSFLGKSYTIAQALKREGFTTQAQLKKAGYKINFSLKLLNVFNTAQLENYENQMDEVEFVSPTISTFMELFPVEIKDVAIACFIPQLDKIVMPPLERFENENHFLKILLHEISHYTGGSERLNRPFGAKNTILYCKEELVAELSSLLLYIHFGFNDMLNSTAAYIKSYLIGFFEVDTWETELFSALLQAEKATAYVINEMEKVNAWEVKNTLKIMDPKNIRYIVMLLNPNTQQYLSTGERIETHDGEIFSSLEDAKEYAVDSIQQNLCTRFSIGMFVFDKQTERISISCVETFGFKNDKKNINQLSLFS